MQQIPDKEKEERKSFQDLPGNENPQFLEDGKIIYMLMRKKYPEDTTLDMDNILNGICASIITLMKTNVNKDNHKYFLQLIWNILNKNI